MCDNTDVVEAAKENTTTHSEDDSALDTLLGDLTTADLQTDKLLSETIKYPEAESPVEHTRGVAMGGTLKEYEDQLTALRKENFKLKLHIYFLEERLQDSSSPQSHKELMSKNLDLKIRVGSLSKELKEHKALLRSAADALEFTEQTAAKTEGDLDKIIIDLKIELQEARAHQISGLTSEDSVALYTEAFNLNKIPKPKIQVNDETVESAFSLNTEENQPKVESVEKENAEIEKLKQENTKLYRLMQGCLERIKRMDKIEQRQKENLQHKEETIAALQDAKFECERITNKYKEIIENRDRRVSELEHNMNKMNIVNAQGDENSSFVTENINVQEMLTQRLREMAYFLDTLISHRCVIGEDKQKRIESLLEESLRLPIDLELDPEASRLLATSLMENSINEQSMNILDITKLLAHHTSLNKSLQPHQPAAKETHSDDPCIINNKSNIAKSRHYGRDGGSSEVKQALETVEQEKTNAIKELNEATYKISILETQLECKKEEFQTRIIANQKQTEKLNNNIENCLKELHLTRKNNKREIEDLQKENTKLLEENKILVQDTFAKIQIEKVKWQKEVESLKANFVDHQQQLERQYEELRKERKDMEEGIVKMERQKESLLRREEEVRRQEERHVGRDLRNDIEDNMLVCQHGEVCQSPDQGIDSDRHSSLELPDSYSSQGEILTLRSQLKETEQKLEAALRKLTPLQLQHRKVERAICKQIHKTTAVLKEAKKNFNN